MRLSRRTVLLSTVLAACPWFASATGNPVLPRKILALYFYKWKSPRLSEIQKAAPHFNLIYFAFATGTNDGGKVFFKVEADAGGEANFASDLKAWKASGRVALLSVGGGDNAGLMLQHDRHAKQFLDTITPIIDRLGFQGIDWDLETSGKTFTVETVVKLTRALKKRYGRNFVISMAPRPFEFRSGGIYLDMATQLDDDIDLIGLQFYDYDEARDPRQRWVIRNDIQQAVRVIPPSKLMMGALAPHGGTKWSPTHVYRDAFQEMHRMYPDLRGAFVWDSPNEKASGWAIHNALAPLIMKP